VKRYSSGDFIILLFYIDDMLIIENDLIKIKTLTKRFGNKFIIKDLGMAR
jgi:hypothetical protein